MCRRKSMYHHGNEITEMECSCELNCSESTRWPGLADGERGSISVLTIGLFHHYLLAYLITDIATIAVAKRSLVHATESAALRAVQSLDRAAYYRGDTGIDIPIDCSTARLRVIEELGL